jgi:hypothetical protein
VHYQEPISENLFRRVIARVGGQCEAADQGRLQEELKPSEGVAEVLVVEVDGSLLPIRGPEPWKEAKVGVFYRHDSEANEPIAGSADRLTRRTIPATNRNGFHYAHQGRRDPSQRAFRQSAGARCAFGLYVPACCVRSIGSPAGS